MKFLRTTADPPTEIASTAFRLLFTINLHHFTIIHFFIKQLELEAEVFLN
jgi:hypothetical protein